MTDTSNSKVKNYFGIDFGTTNCAIYGFTKSGNNVASIQYGDEEGRPFPSIVAIHKTTGEVFTGRDARRKKTELDESCKIFSSVKSVIDEDQSYLIAGKQWTPVMIATELFKMLKDEVWKRTKTVLDSATIAIPVGLNAPKRAKIREAAINAGIQVKSFISEPTAAFLANYRGMRFAKNIAVFDWGGGTLDCSVISHSNGRIEELASDGMYLAGDNIDAKLAERVHSKVAESKGSFLAFEDMPSSARDNMLVRCEQTKIKFGDSSDKSMTLLNYGELGIVNQRLSYDWFCEVIRPEIEQAMECLQRTIRQSGVGEANIDAVLLVGGSSNLNPLVSEMKKKYGEERVYSPSEKMWSVARGAAIITIEPGAYMSNQSIGLKMSDGSYFELLPKNKKLSNWNVSNTFGIVDSRKEARFIFTGSKDIDESDNHFKVLEIPTYRFLEEVINLVAFVDKDLVFTVVAGSSMKPKSYRRVWQYLKLKAYFMFPDEEIFNI